MAAAAVVAIATVSGGWAESAREGVGRVFASEKKTVRDETTGVEMTVLTDGTFSDWRVYHTHPQWTSDGEWIVFRSSARGGEGKGEQAFAVHEASGVIVQLTAGVGNKVGALHLSRREMKLWYLRHAPLPAGVTPPTTRPDDAEITQVVELDLGRLLSDAKSGSARAEAGAYERIAATLPVGLHEAGGFGLDASEKMAYIGVRGLGVGDHLPAGVTPYPKPEGARMGAGPGGIRKIDLVSGEVSVVIDTPFLVGHVQANPWVEGEILFCWETGGKAPQRMWTVRADGSGQRALFPEASLDWITHEVFVSKDEILFNLIGHKPELRARPTGIALLNLRTNYVTLLGQVDETVDGDKEFHGPGGFWHCNGSHDGKWAAGDTFLGNVWLINRLTGERRLLTTDHKMKPDHCHPSFSADSKKLLIQSGKWTEGKKLQLVVIPLP